MVPAVPRRVAAGLMIGLATVSLARTVSAASPVGVWYAEGGAARVQIDPCADAICGRVVWLRSPFDEDGCDQRDGRNPDPALRDRPLVGLEVLTGLQASGDGERWSGGTIYDPASGRTYRCSARLDGPDRLHIRGFIGVPLLGLVSIPPPLAATARRPPGRHSASARNRPDPIEGRNDNRPNYFASARSRV